MNIFAAFSSNASRAFLVGLFLLVVTAIAIAVSSGDTLRYDDEQRYHDLAISLTQKHEYASSDGRPTAWWPPGYPFAIGVAYVMDARPISAKLLNVAFLCLAVLVAGRLATRVQPNAAVFVPYLAMCYPVLLYTSSTLYPQILGTLLFLVAILLVSAERLSMAGAALAGLVCGTLCLTIPSFMLAMPILAAYVVLVGSTPYRRSLLKAVLMGTITIATMTPWMVRNYVQFHAVIPVSTNGGVNLLLGNSPFTEPNIKPAETAFLCPQASNPKDEVGYDRALTHCALDWVSQNPIAAAHLYLGKVVNYFNYRNRLSTESEMADWKNWLMLATYYPLLILAIVRLGLLRRMRLTRVEMLLYSLYFLNALISAVFFTRVRFRIPFDLLLIVIDSAFIAKLIDLYSRRGLVQSSGSIAAS